MNFEFFGVDGAIIDRTFENPNDLIAKVDEKSLVEVYENGCVFRSKIVPDSGSGRYDTATSGLWIVKNDGEVTFVIDAIDGRYEDNRKLSDSKIGESIWYKVNLNKIEELISQLGPMVKIDTTKPNLFNKGRLNKKNELIKQKRELLVAQSLSHLNSLNIEKSK